MRSHLVVPILALTLWSVPVFAEDSAKSSRGPPLDSRSLEQSDADSGLSYQLNGTDGFLVVSDDESLHLHFGGVLAVDHVHYDSRNSRDSGVNFDRAVLRVDGSYHSASWRIAPDLKGIDTRHGLDEAWFSYEPTRLFRVTAGLQELSLSMQHDFPEEKSPFVGHGFPVYLDGSTDFSLRCEGEVAEGLFYYDLAGSVGEGFDHPGNRLSGPRVSAKGRCCPLRMLDPGVELWNYEIPLLSGFFFELGYLHRDAYRGPLEVATPLRSVLFEVDRFHADSSDFLHMGYGFDLGPFLLLHEWVPGGYQDVEMPGGGETDLENQVAAWTALFAWMIAGESYDSSPFRRSRKRGSEFPKRPVWGVTPEKRGPGELETDVSLGCQMSSLACS